MSHRICKIEGCDKPYLAREWCGAHYAKWRKYGDPLMVAPRKTAAQKGIPKRCGVCGETKDIVEFPQGWSPCKPCRAELHYSQGKRCSICDTRLVNSVISGFCREHWGAYRRTLTKPGRRTRNGGYIVLSGQWDHPNARARGTLLEHVKVMSEMLGRPLVEGENVHHINGVRDDNRPENLELWNTTQPPGQRVPDKVAWAKEILSLYEPDALAQPMLNLATTRGVA